MKDLKRVPNYDFGHFIHQSLLELAHGKRWKIINDFSYEDIVWEDDSPKPSKAEVEQKAAELQQTYLNSLYQQQRASEYPPITDYLDGVVKGDQAQIDAYIAACQAVKAKYPKA